MKYLEELNAGDSFYYKNNYFVLTADYKKDGSKQCLSLYNGFYSWFRPDTTVEDIQLYTLDNNQNLISIKKYEKTNP